MNWDRIQGNWKQFKGNAKQQWGKLTDDQLDMIEGKRDQLAGKSRKRTASVRKHRRSRFPSGSPARRISIARPSNGARHSAGADHRSRRCACSSAPEGEDHESIDS